MPELTRNIKLKKPLDHETADIKVINENMDKIDDEIIDLQNEVLNNSKLNTKDKTHTGAINEIHKSIIVHQADVEKQVETLNDEKMDKVGGEFTGIVKAKSNTSYTVAQIRNVILSPNDADVEAMKNGEIWIKYGDI
ncbi:hypothetical protein [Anaerophilus nitritogenes]|uniref:hypothetical protein n=1 Tax=Anaerophilus nitritogenes TaxID=2498136 RepID=UPI00101C40E6|nr:hypothetical protein [Anaerophilus nitritogenes]